MCVMAFGNWSVGGRVGRRAPLSPFSPDLTSFMRQLCLVTMVREKEGVQEIAESSFQYQTAIHGFEDWGRVQLSYPCDSNFSVALWCLCPLSESL